ncbi:MAG TPA: transcriptional regulator [Caulobacteraceae bacterium]|jgi:DNA-binding MarR family transcriptional regulator
MDDFDIAGIDETIHGRVRLGVMAWLVGHEDSDFNALKTRLNASDGNLSVHLRKLEEAGYIAIAKSFVDRKSMTRVRLTPAGREAFIGYLAAMQRLVAEARIT